MFFNGKPTRLAPGDILMYITSVLKGTRQTPKKNGDGDNRLYWEQGEDGRHVPALEDKNLFEEFCRLLACTHHLSVSFVYEHRAGPVYFAFFDKKQ
jgi:hypothetical protein